MRTPCRPFEPPAEADLKTPWRHIDVSYNFQLHHVPFALEKVGAGGAQSSGKHRAKKSPKWLMLIGGFTQNHQLNTNFL